MTWGLTASDLAGVTVSVRRIVEECREAAKAWGNIDPGQGYGLPKWIRITADWKAGEWPTS